jgi:hypothetical protein
VIRSDSTAVCPPIFELLFQLSQEPLGFGDRGSTLRFFFSRSGLGVVVPQAVQVFHFVMPPSLENGGCVIHDFRVGQCARQHSAEISDFRRSWGTFWGTVFRTTFRHSTESFSVIAKALSTAHETAHTATVKSRRPKLTAQPQENDETGENLAQTAYESQSADLLIVEFIVTHLL